MPFIIASNNNDQLSILGAYATKEDAKKAVDNMAPSIIQNNQPLPSLYELNEDNKLYTFTKKDLQAAHERFIKTQEEQLKTQQEQLKTQHDHLQQQIENLRSQLSSEDGGEKKNQAHPAQPQAPMMPPAPGVSMPPVSTSQ
jgi:hypothetical protein